MALVILALSILALGIINTHFLVFLSFQKHFYSRAGVFSVSRVLQKYFCNTLEDTIKFCSLEWVVLAFLKIMVEI